MGVPPKKATDNLPVNTNINCYREEEKRKRKLEEEIEDRKTSKGRLIIDRSWVRCQYRHFKQ